MENHHLPRQARDKCKEHSHTKPRVCVPQEDGRGEVFSCDVDTSDLQIGEHAITVMAAGAWTQLGVARDHFEPFGARFTPNASVHVHFQ
jgi:hypothetical protein